MGQTYISSRSGLARRRFPFRRRFNLEPPVDAIVFNGDFDVASSSSVRRYAQGAPQRRLHRARNRRRRRRIMRLRERGWTPYALRLEPERHAWVALVMDWQRAA